MPRNERLYAAIVEYAKQAGISYPKAIEKIGHMTGYKDPRQFYYFIRGVRTPSGKNQHRIARALGLTVDELFGAVCTMDIQPEKRAG